MAMPRRSLRNRDNETSPKAKRLLIKRKRQNNVDEESYSEESDSFEDDYEGEASRDVPDRAREPSYGFVIEDDESPRPRLIKRKGLYPDLDPLLKDNPTDKADKHIRKRLGPTPVILISMSFLFILSLIILGHFVFHIFSSPAVEPELKTLEQVAYDIKAGLKRLYQDTHQSKEFWTHILSQVQLLTEPHPASPAILLMVIPKDASFSAACIARQLQDIVAGAFEDKRTVTFDSESHSGWDADSVKFELEETFQVLSNSHTISVHNLEKLPPEATFILHAFCDHENAIYKRAFILFTVELKYNYDTLQSSKMDFLLHETLMNHWSLRLREIDAAAIYSRITNSPILLKPEFKSVIEKLCPY